MDASGTLIHNLILSLSLLLVIEGLLPFLNPGGFIKSVKMISQLSETQLRTGGLVSMLAGVLIMYVINN